MNKKKNEKDFHQIGFLIWVIFMTLLLFGVYVNLGAFKEFFQGLF